jgi:hypothetical protein
MTPRQIAGQMMQDTASPGAYQRQTAVARSASSSEFGSREEEAAFLKASGAGLVRIYHGKTRQTTLSTARGNGVTDGELERDWQTCSAATRREFGDDKRNYFAFRRAEARGLVTIIGRARR